MNRVAASDRLYGEPARPYAAFVLYRDMGPQRSTAAVGRELGKSKTLMDRWSAHWSWVERVEAWGAEQARVRLQAQFDEAVASGQRQALLAQRAQLALSQPTRALMARMQEDPDKLLGELKALQASELLALIAVCTRALKPAVEIERLARGMTTSTIAVRPDVASA